MVDWTRLLIRTDRPDTPEMLGYWEWLIGRDFHPLVMTKFGDWFLADPEALAKYYGKEFLASAIGGTQDVEKIQKADVLHRLKQASRNTQKGEYHKVKHAPHLLERLDADRVQKHASQCRKLFDAVKARLQGS